MGDQDQEQDEPRAGLREQATAQDAARAPELPVVVRRSARRRRTVSAQLRDGIAVVSIPAHFNTDQEGEWVRRMLVKLRRRYGEWILPDPPDARYASERPENRAGEESPTSVQAGAAAPSAAGELAARARRLSERYLNGRGQPETIRWVTNQNTRWGSATPANRSIRLSHQLQGMPEWVVDYVLLHEMAHLIEPSHSSDFWRLLESYPRTGAAKAFLAGAAFTASRGMVARRDTRQGGEGRGTVQPQGRGRA